jgi:UDP-N-acetylglucosamine pyrophosphorylase
MAEPQKAPPLAVVIMAAGKGTRMKNPDMAKVMYEIDDRPMVAYVVDLAAKLQASRTLLVVGWQKASVIAHIGATFPSVEFVEQNEQRGTGHAVMQTMPALKEFEGDLLVLSGDVPLLSEKTARALLGYHRASAASATILTADLDDPTGYGRIIRNSDDSVERIVEHKDASKKELSVKEVNSGIYLFNKERLFACLGELTPNNAQGEYYLTDVFASFWRNKWLVSAVKVIDPIEVMGINDLDQLEVARRIMGERENG